ncbi:LPD38 domain-containing protein [Vreelandella glaciei]|uniref:LPD38 domain-containing protein n=1 Tax=Vreelandella glaciei TaxID=186761 RepID=UPI0030EBAB68|tara:strand:- start:3885 stop:15002 length:11118 start_codon:yes stop_codon:yes gene_type:complete
MAAPWEKYQQNQQSAPAAPSKPWERYAKPEAPTASEQPAEQASQPVEPTGLAMERESPLEQPSQQSEPTPEGIRASDFGREALEGGVSGTGFAVGGAGDFLSWGGDLVESGLRKLGLGELVDKGDAALGNMAPSDAFQAFEGWMQKGSEQIDASQTEAFRETMKNSTPDGDLFKPSTWSFGDDPSATGYAAQMAGLIGQFAPQAATMLAGTPQRVAVAMTLMGGTQAGGSQASEAEERVMGMDKAQLSEASTLYSDLREQGMKHEDAQQQTAKTAGAAAFLGGAPVGAAGGAVTSYVLGPMQRAIGGGMVGRAVDSVGLQAPAEALQEVSETMMARANTNRAVGGNQDISEGTFGDAALGGMFGGGLGLAGAAAGGRNATPERTPADAVRERTPEDIAAIREQYDAQPSQAAPQEAEAAPDVAMQASGLDMEGQRQAQQRWEDAWREQAAQDGIADYDPNADLPDTTITINGDDAAQTDGLALQDSVAQIEKAASETNTEPTPAQAEAGNYRKGRVRLNGFDIAIENPKGSTRRGTAPDGTEWESNMAHHYGDIKGTKAADGDNLDVFVGENPSSQRAYVVDQINPDGSFDEHKVLLGFDSLEQARKGYLDNYEDGWQGLGDISETPVENLKQWVSEGAMELPFGNVPTANREAAEEATPAIAPDQPSENPDRITPKRVPVADIQVDPEAYQFRTNVNQDGVDSRLEGVEKWDDLRAGNLVLHERLDGTLYAADGHHRINLARKLEQPDVNALVLREADGVTVEDARIEAATANIAAGNASAIDAAKVFRNTDAKPSEAISRFDLPRKSLVVRDGIDIAKLANEPFGAVLNGVVTEKDGATIGRAFDDPDQQMAAIDVFQRVKPTNDNQRALLANEVRQAGFAESQGEQGGLFGDDPAESLIGERVRVMDSLRQTLVRDRRLFATLNDNAQTAEQAGNRIAKERNDALQDASAEAVALLERATTTPEINQQINDAARRVKEGETLASVTRELKETLLNGPDAAAAQQPRTPAPSSRPADQAGQDAGRSGQVPGGDDARAAGARQQRVGDDAGQQQAGVTLKSDGTPFQTRRAVELSKRFRDTPNAQPIEVDGGWGFSVGEQSEPEPLLNTYTEAELAEQERARQESEADDQANNREQEQRAQADRDADDFVLSGSNRPNDIAESRGQNDIFGSQPAPQAATPKPRKPRKPAELTPRQQRASDAFGGAMAGDNITLNQDVGYARAGSVYKVNSIGKDGSLDVTNVETSSSTVISQGEWVGAYRRANAALADVASKAAPEEAAQPQSSWGDSNTLVSRDRADEIRERLRAKLGQLNSGIDPEMLSLGTELAAFHLEAGARRFNDFARTMARDLGTNVEQIRPYLRAWYNGGRDMMEDSGLDIEGMDDPSAVRQALNALTNEGDADVPSTSQRAESDTGIPAAENNVGRDAVRDESGRAQRGDGGAGEGTGSERSGRPGRTGVSEDSARASRAGGDNRVHRANGEYGAKSEPAGRNNAGRSDNGNDGRAPTDARASRAVTRHAKKTLNAVSQSAPKAITENDVVPASLDSIAETLPQLLKVQQEDVAFAERRFFEANGRGVLFANGTGTGKTYSGLGIAKRHALMGRSNILIVVPSDKIARDWMAAGENVDLSIKQLRDTRDNGGEGAVITTYANFRQNNSLAEREWDLIMADEAHNLLQRDEFQETGALSTLRALTGYPGSSRRLAEMQRPDLVEQLETLRAQSEAARVQALDSGRGEDANREAQLSEARKKASDELAQLAREIEDSQAQKWEARGTRAAFLSATPFAYRKSVEWANGYLFDYAEGQPEQERVRGYNEGDARESFFMQNFGYQMRYNKLNAPGAEVDIGLMEREFNEKLKREGAMRARMLEVDQDYDRRFQLVADGIGTRIDEGLEWLQDRARTARDKAREGDDAAQAEASAWDELSERISKRFSYLNRAYLLESIKAKHAIPYIEQHLKQGRKVVVFHDYNQGGGFHPFRPMAGEGDSSIFKRFKAERPDLYNLDLSGLPSPRDALNKAFGDRLVEFNGTIGKAERSKNVERFNRDGSGVDVIAVQSDAGGAGISLHDTTGKHQRVLLNLGLPVKPTAAIQIEGRIYRVGVQSDAIMRYMSTGLSMERSMVASKLAERAGTAENLAMGNLARALKDNIIEAYQDADNYPAGMEGEGTGGKNSDRTASEMTDFDRSKSFYYGQQKRNARNKSREGKDYFATPEPVGLKMVEWAGIRAGDDVLEPSAGHGAIARWIPETAQTHLVEPSYELASRLRLAAGDARVYETTFEDLAKSNKYDSIVMNPPFGLGGSTAIAHLDRAFKKHLRQGGRVVALIPTGPAANKRFDKWLEETDGVSMAADIKLPASTFERAATSVATRIVILDKRADEQGGAPSRLIDLSDADTINDLFDRIEGVDIGRDRPAPPTDGQVDTAAAELAEQGAAFETAQTTHAKKGIELFVAKMNGRVERDAFNALRDLAKANGGYWSSYKRDGAIPGFQFESAEQRQAFIDAASDSSLGQRYAVNPQSDRPETPPAAGDVAAALEGMSEQLGDFEVVGSTTDLPPMSLLKMALNGVNPLDVRGFYEGNRLYVIAANNDNVDQAVKTAIHEAVGHKGIRGVLGEELTPVMRQLYNRLPHSKIGRQARDEVLRDYPFLDRNNPDDQVTIAEEMVAHLIEKGHRPAAWQRAVAKIKALLRRLFPAIPWTTTDVLELGERSRDYLRRLQAETDQGNADNMTFAMRRRIDQSRVSDEFPDLDADQAEALDMIGPLGATGSAMVKVREIWDRAAVKLRAGLVDKYAALKELDEKALGRDFIESSTASSSWVLARMAPAAQGALHTLIHNGRIRLDPEQKVIELQEGEKNSLHEVLAQLGDSAEVSRFMGWIAGNRAEKLREQGRENYFEERHIRGLMELNNGRAKNGEARRTLYPRVFEEFQAIRDDVLSIAEQSGLLRKAMSEPEAALTIARQYGAPDTLINKLKRADASLRNDADGDMLDSAQAIYAQAQQELEQWLDSHVNDTAQPDALNTPEQQLDNIMQEWESLTRDQREIWAEEFYVPFYRVLDENTHDVQGPASTAGLTRQRAYQRLKGADMRIGDLLENTLMNYHHLLSASLKNQAAIQAIENAEAVGIAGEVSEAKRDPKTSTFVLRDGKQVFYEISDDLVYKALVNMTDAGMKAVMDSSGLKAMRWFKRLLTNMVTVTPEFVAANTIRDSLQSAAVTPAGLNPLWNAVRGAGYYANKRNRAQMIASGGSFNFGHLYGDRSDELKAQLNRNLRRAKVINDPGAALQAGKFLWRRWNEATEFAENINRAKVYQANLDRGKLYAAFQSRDLMDFSNHGSWFMTRFLIDTVPFLNARIQGLDKLYRDGFKPTLLTAFGKGDDSDKVRAKRFSIVTGALMVASIGLLMHNNDDEDYQALPEWQKDTYWYIRNGDDVYFIPKPFEVGAISTMAERVTQQFIDDTAGGDLFKERLWHMISQTFSFSPVPQAAAPLLDIYANRDPFRDRPIEPYWDQQLSPSLRFRSSTTMPARWMSGSLEGVVGNDSMLALSPLQIDYLVNGYLGSVGGYASGIADTFWRRANGQKAPSSRWTESRPIRRFYRDMETPAYSTRYMDVFYEGLKEADRVYSDLRKMEEMGAIEEARELAQNKGDLLRLRKQLQDARGDLSDINKRMDQVRQSEEMDPDYKRRELERLRTVRNRITEALGREVEQRRMANDA